jgi:dephospho-CoA kinase
LLVAGLTGGIASGKSTVCRMMRQAGALIIDADLLAREVVAPELPAWREICDLFGSRILAPDKSIDRAALGRLVFADEVLRRRLEAIIHPRVKKRMDEEVERIGRQFPQAVVVEDVPLLLESGMEEGLREIILVYVPKAVQLQRLMLRDGLDPDQARSRINAQAPIEEKRRKATIVIDNSGSLSDTRRQTLAVYKQLERQTYANENRRS